MDLRFNGKVGRLPEPGSAESMLLAACSVEDKRLWRDVAALPSWEIYEAIERLQRLGWGFELVTIQ